MATRVSVIIPSYNSAHFLETSIQSVLRQAFDDFEIIVVDDGSTDNCEEIAAKFGNAIKYIRQDNRGLAGARNTGIQASSGDLISLLDADDEWHPDYLENMIALSERHPDAIVFYCMAQCMDMEGRDLPQFVGGPPVDQKALYHVLLRANFIIPSTVTFRKKAIAEAGNFDASLRSCEDWDLWLRILPREKIIGVSKSLVRYRVHNSSLSTNLDGMHSAARRVIEKKFGIDVGNPAEWSPEKRRAYGGVYRYQCITYVQRQNNWDASSRMMKKALQIDPSLSMDVDFFYELILGTQPVGYRGVSKIQSFDEKSTRFQDLVSGSVDRVDGNTRKQTLGTSNYALGLAAYHLGPRSLFRRYFARALAYRPELFFNVDLLGMYFKSFLSQEQLKKLKKVMDRHS